MVGARSSLPATNDLVPGLKQYTRFRMTPPISKTSTRARGQYLSSRGSPRSIPSLRSLTQIRAHKKTKKRRNNATSHNTRYGTKKKSTKNSPCTIHTFLARLPRPSKIPPRSPTRCPHRRLPSHRLQILAIQRLLNHRNRTLQTPSPCRRTRPRRPQTRLSSMSSPERHLVWR